MNTLFTDRWAVAPSDFIELDASWPLSDGDFLVLSHIAGRFPTCTERSVVDLHPDELATELQVDSRTVVAQLKRLQSAGYINWSRNIRNRESKISLYPIFRRIAVYYRLVAKSENRAWLVFHRFPDDPVAIMQLDHDLAPGTPIALFTIRFWESVAPALTSRTWRLDELRKLLQAAAADRTSGLQTTLHNRKVAV